MFEERASDLPIMSPNEEQNLFARTFRDHVLAAVPGVRPVATHVPRRLVQFWDKEPPEDVAAMLEANRGWSEKHGIEYVFFDEVQARDYLAGHVVGDASADGLFDHCFHPAMKADLFRLVYLHEFGGFYVDADNGATDAALPLFDLDRDLFFIDVSQKRVQNNFMAVAPGSRLIGNVLEAAAHNILHRAREDIGIGTLTGPYVFTVELQKLMQSGSAYRCYLVDYLENLKVAPGAEQIIGKQLDYKASDQNWQRAQAGPLAKNLREKLEAGEGGIPMFRELARLSLKFGLDIDVLEKIAASRWDRWQNNAACVALRGRILVRLGRLPEARDHLQAAYDRGLRTAAILAALSGLNMRPEKLAYAEELARAAVRENEENADAVAQLAAVLKATCQMDECAKIVEKGLARFPANLRLAALEKALVPYNAAMKLLSELLARDEESDAPTVEQFRDIAKCCLEYGTELSTAEALAARYWKDWQNFPEGVKFRAKLLVRMNKHPDAKAVLETALAQDMRTADILTMLSGLNMQPGQLEDAEKLSREALDKAPHRADVVAQRIAVLKALGKFDEASLMVAAALERHPNHPRLRHLSAALGKDIS